jgi:hypothetical protein
MKLTFTSSVTSCSRQGVLVEETLDAIYPDLGSGNKPPFIHFWSTNINGTSWIKPPSGNDYEVCWRRSWDAGNKDFSWDAWK